jgi:predicted amidophosphoribosyltransferase
MIGGALRLHLRNYLDEVTEQWIGWTFPPVERAIEGASWSPDARAAYCARCGDSVGPGEATPDGCATCRKGSYISGGIGDGVVRLGPYVDAMRDWVLKIKYERWAEMGECLGHQLGRQVRAAGAIHLNSLVIVPMPMPWQRRIYRGIDHAAVIASSVASELHAPIVSVFAKANLPPQVSLPASARKRSGSHGLRIRWRLGGWPLDGWNVLLVDDVRTTGASLKAAIRLLRPLKPARIVCGVLAVADSPARRARSTPLGAEEAPHGYRRLVATGMG